MIQTLQWIARYILIPVFAQIWADHQRKRAKDPVYRAQWDSAETQAAQAETAEQVMEASSVFQRLLSK